MANRAIQQFEVPERVNHYAIFDASIHRDIPEYVTKWQCKRVVLVTSKSLYTQQTVIQTLQEKLGTSIVAIKVGVGAHSPYADVLEIAHLLQTHDADCLVSIGSGSYSDACKVAAYLASTMPPAFTASDMEGMVDESKGTGILKPATTKLILVPTSLSAGEWNGSGSCTNSEGKKQHFSLGKHLLGGADLILLDPDVASTAPEIVWLSSGVRCIDHCVETICDLKVSKDAVEDALDGLTLMVKGLQEYVQGQGRHDRTELLKGISEAQKASRQAIKGLLVYHSTFGPSHAIGHQLGSVGNVMHGLNSCILLGPVLKYTEEEKRSRQALVQECFNKTLGWQESSAADACIRFVKTLGLPTRMSEVGVTEEDKIQKVAEKTLTDIWGGGKPQLTTKEEVMEILNMAR